MKPEPYLPLSGARDARLGWPRTYLVLDGKDFLKQDILL